MRRCWIAFALGGALLACKREAPEGATAPAGPAAAPLDEGKHDALPKRLSLTRQVLDDAKIRVEPASRQALSEGVTLPGEVSADPDKIASVSSPVSGRLHSVRFREGSVVKRGEVMATLQVPDLGKAKADSAAFTARSLAARDNAERLQSLADKGLASDQELLGARSEAEALAAQAQAAQGLLRTLGAGTGSGSELPLRAPIAGTVIQRSAIVGQPVSPEQSLATIADLGEALFLARVFEMDLERVQLGAAVEVRLNAYPEQPFRGVVEYIGRQVDPNARTVTARIRLHDERGLLRVGLFGSAFVQVSSGEGNEPVLVVPQSAIVTIADRSVVFVREGEHDFLLHEVTLGARSLGKVRVVSGLREGEQVVIDGAFTLKSIALKSTFAEED